VGKEGRLYAPSGAVAYVGVDREVFATDAGEDDETGVPEDRFDVTTERLKQVADLAPTVVEVVKAVAAAGAKPATQLSAAPLHGG
jgi:hypothetical protein